MGKGEVHCYPFVRKATKIQANAGNRDSHALAWRGMAWKIPVTHVNYLPARRSADSMNFRVNVNCLHNQETFSRRLQSWHVRGKCFPVRLICLCTWWHLISGGPRSFQLQGDFSMTEFTWTELGKSLRSLTVPKETVQWSRNSTRIHQVAARYLWPEHVLFIFYTLKKKILSHGSVPQSYNWLHFERQNKVVAAEISNTVIYWLLFWCHIL